MAINKFEKRVILSLKRFRPLTQYPRSIPKSRVRIFLAFWLFILSGVAFLDRTNISIAGLQIGLEYGLKNELLGWVFSAFLIGYAGFQLPAGYLSARFGPRKVLTIGVLWWGVATAATAWLPPNISNPVAWLIAIRFLLGAGESVIYPAANQFVARWIPQEERGFVNGLIFAGVGAGSGLTPPLVTWIIVEHGWRDAFYFSALVGAVAALVWWVLARDTPEEHPGVSGGELRKIEAGLLEGGMGHDAGGLVTGNSWTSLFLRKDLLALVIGYFSFGYVAWVYFSWFFVYMTVRGFNLKASARFDMLPFFCMTAGSLLGGWLSDRLAARYGLRVGRCFLATAAMVTTGVFLIIGSQLRSPEFAGFVLAIGAGALYVSQSSFWSISVDIAGRRSGLFSSVVNMGGQLGGALTASLTPVIASHFGWTSSFAVAAALAFIGAFSWFLVDLDPGAESYARGPKRGLAPAPSDVP
jgi:ACS family glucarate transporter-like MFS transporter